MLIDIDFTSRHVAVFGGTSGINLGVAEGFARRGARLSVVSRSATKVAAACRQLGGNAHGACADVRDMAAVQAACAGAAERFGPIDVLVSGAAGNFPASASALSSNGFRAVVDIDLLGTFHVVRAAYPHLRKPGASVINISAPQATIPMRYQAHVCAAKAGVDQLTRVLALEWGAAGVRVRVAEVHQESTESMESAEAAESTDPVEAAEPLLADATAHAEADGDAGYPPAPR